MSGLFHRLAARALGVAPTAEPIVPAMFAPGPPLAPESLTNEPSIPAPRSVNDTTEGAVNLPSPRPRPAEGSLLDVLDRREPRNREATSPAEPRKGRTIDSTQPLESPQVLERSLPPLLGPAIAQSTNAELVTRLTQATLPAANPPSSSAHIERKTGHRELHAAESSFIPVIRVSIGRIDVRAELPTPAPPQARRQRSPSMSLDEYARLRAEGKR